MARERSGPTVAHLVLATRLKELRERAGLSPGQAADALGAHPATVRRIEQARTSLDEGQVHTLLRAYGAGPAEIREILGKLATANLPGWWHPWRAVMDSWQLDLMSVESAASVVRTWDPALVPALLRTPDYARAVLDALWPFLSPADRDRRTEFLMERQERVRAQQTHIWALMSAAALHTRVGGEEIMAGQMRKLRSAAGRREATLQVHALHGPPHVLTECPSLTLFRVDVPEIPDHVVRQGSPAGSADVVQEPAAVAAYRTLLDYSCLTASHPHKWKEVLP
ncbi:helix-turn-helix domain-containing protein [Streptomyces sp. MAR4 CNX-425]|uniref:helix-turn-helix domain-containing protein n=1 Tax=Streptomyces sp. MAR4 CNX-425 TaxID=3406343 RepID=UPI003B510CE0